MLHYHMIVVTADGALQRAIKRLTTAAGATADFTTTLAGFEPTRPVDLAIFDARQGAPDAKTTARLPKTTRFLYILEPQQLSRQVELFADERVASLFTYDTQFDDDEFIASATKALRGDVFGLQKYFPWGVTTFTMVVKSYEEKGRAIDIMMRYAKMAGVRGPVRDRVQLVADELMMNALYHAPTDDQGRELYRDRSLKELAELPQVQPIQVQYGCSGRYFGVSVRDGGGSLSRKRALEYLRRANQSTQIETKATGAGLGLVSVLRSASKLVFNLDPGSSTEVVAMFDMELMRRGQVGARSLHLFSAAPDDDEDDAVDEAPAAASPPVRSGTWAFAAVLAALAAALGTAYYMQRGVDGARAATALPTLTVVPTPAEADVSINGTPVAAGVAWPVPRGAQTVEIAVERDGFQPWRSTVETDDLSDHNRVYVTLPAAE